MRNKKMIVFNLLEISMGLGLLIFILLTFNIADYKEGMNSITPVKTLITFLAKNVGATSLVFVTVNELLFSIFVTAKENNKRYIKISFIFYIISVLYPTVSILSIVTNMLAITITVLFVIAIIIITVLTTLNCYFRFIKENEAVAEEKETKKELFTEESLSRVLVLAFVIFTLSLPFFIEDILNIVK